MANLQKTLDPWLDVENAANFDLSLFIPIVYDTVGGSEGN